MYPKLNNRETSKFAFYVHIKETSESVIGFQKTVLNIIHDRRAIKLIGRKEKTNYSFIPTSLFLGFPLSWRYMTL